jgi:hypothetical protein
VRRAVEKRESERQEDDESSCASSGDGIDRDEQPEQDLAGAELPAGHRCSSRRPPRRLARRRESAARIGGLSGAVTMP